MSGVRDAGAPGSAVGETHPPLTALEPTLDDLRRYSWYHFTALSGPEARRWIGELHSGECRRIQEDVELALLLFRRRQLAEADALLGDVDERLRGFAEADAKGHVLRRFYLGSLAYGDYVRGDLDAAERASIAAGEEVRRAIELQRFLLPLAHHCHEFLLQRARIARNRRDWAAMRRLVAEVEEMLRGRRPYCVLADGTAIGVREVVAFCAAIPGLGEAELAHIHALTDGRAGLRLFRSFVGRLYALPGMVVPYP